MLVRNAEQFRRASEPGIRRSLEQAEALRRRAAEPAFNMRRKVEEIQDAIRGPAWEAHRQYRDLTRWLSSYDLAHALEKAREVSEQALQELRLGLPANWRELSIEDAEKAHELVRDEGVPIVWVPSQAIVERVIANEQRDMAMAALRAEQDGVLDDIEESLDEVTESDLVEMVDKARRAVAPLRDDHPEAAQALAAAVFTATIHDGLKLPALSDMREKAEELPPDDADMSSYRTALVYQLGARCVQGEKWVLPGFNRSECLHHVSSAQYTPENSLAAVLTCAALLREAHELRESGRI
jgi:hypothetical protein